MVKSRKAPIDSEKLWGRVKGVCLPDLQCAFAAMYAHHTLSNLSDEVISYLEQSTTDPITRLFYEGHIDLEWRFYRREICEHIKKKAEGCENKITKIVEEEDGL